MKYAISLDARIDVEVEALTMTEILRKQDNITILCHSCPDGDTIGSAFALYHALTSLGKRCKIECADAFGVQFAHITNNIQFEEFEAEFVVAVDVADRKLLGSLSDKYPVIHMAFDHHATHKVFAEMVYVKMTAASACEIIYEVVLQLCGSISNDIATALYTGMATDTGCFKYSNTTATSHLIASHLMATTDVDCAKINQMVFSKSKARIMLEGYILSNAEFFCDGAIAIQYVDNSIRDKFGATNDDVYSLASSLQSVTGVMLGITIIQDSETSETSYKISARSKEPISASELCSCFGGGGHPCAAGCTIEGSLQDVKNRLIEKAHEIYTASLS